MDMLASWLGVDHIGVSWLPTHHDMGLVGCVLFCITNQMEFRLLAPETFLKRPIEWIETLSEAGATLAASPPFALEVVARSPVPSSSLDLRRLRTLIVGAERISAHALEEFLRFAEPFGFEAGMFAPAYGLAEATLAVTGCPVNARPLKVRVRANSLQIGSRVHIDNQGDLGAEFLGEADALVESGSPLQGVTVTIIDESGRQCPDGSLGQIVVASPSLATTCTDTVDGTNGLDHGELLTGDAGFILKGRLFVVGRMGDSIKVHGVAIFAETIEGVIASIQPAPARSVAMLGAVRGRDSVIVLSEGRIPSEWAQLALKRIHHELSGADALVEIWSVPRGTLELTASGKPRRRAMWERINREAFSHETLTTCEAGAILAEPES
jgi:acyl-CoA synthetase (AMP-forming)/AMP-acid ligase II